MVETKLLGRYRLDEHLAAGGMGAVYAATDERLGRGVAIKVLKEDLAGDQRFVERFRREARAVAALNHPNIASVFDYGEDESRHFIVMELVRGRDLAQVLHEEKTIEPSRASGIAAQICGALGAAHDAGVIHRDVKPANVILGAGDRVKVTDFGIARAAGQSTLTATGSVLGTAHYLSPEQASGSPLQPQSDLYSLGIVLYEMLTGAPPFSGSSPVSIAMSHVSDVISPPSSLVRDVPENLDRTVMRATAKSPADRFPSAAEMRAALESAQAAESTPVTPAAAPATTRPITAAEATVPSSVEQARPRRAGTRRRSLTPGAIAVGLIALLLLAGALILPRIGDDGGGAGSTQATAGQGNSRGAPETACGATPCAMEPAVIGAPYQEVKQILEGQGYQVEVDFRKADGVAGSIIDTKPAPGTTLEEGSTILLRVVEG